MNARWHQLIKDKDPETQILKQFITQLQEGIHKEYERNLKRHNSRNSPLSQCDNKYDSMWYTAKTETRIDINYSCLYLIDFYTQKEIDREEQESSIASYQTTGEERKKKRENQKDNIVFRHFDKLRSNHLVPKLGSLKAGEDSRIAHTRSIFSSFVGKDDILKYLPGLRVDTVYIFHEKSQVMAIYPHSHNEDYENKELNYKTRPWYRSTENRYDTVYFNKDFGQNKSGLTGIFIDISDDDKPNTVRTLWYSFKGADQQDYIFAIGLFLDKSGAFSGGNSWFSLFWLSNPLEWIVLVLIALPSSFLLSLLYEKLAKRFTPDTNSFTSLSGIKFNLIKEYYATLNDESISFSDNNVKMSLASVQTSSGVKFSLQGTGIEGNIERLAQRNLQEEKVYSYNFAHQYNLKVGPVRPTHKAVQIWQAERKTSLGKSQIVGHMVADWKTNNTVNLWGELSIKSIFWNKKDEIYLPSFQRQLRDHLLAGETGELALVPNKQYQKRQSIPALLSDIDPDKLETVPELKQVIDNSFDLEQGRFFVSELDTIETLYALGHVRAIYSISFIQRIISKGQHDFFRKTAMDTDKDEFRFVLEHEAHHFKNKIYDRLNPSIQDDWKNESPFQILVHQRSNTENVILEQEGFSLIYIDNVLRFVLYSLSDDRYSGIGWVSWRKVDLEFFKTLYEYQFSKRHSVKTVKNYIDGH
ncbi:hypothetical protein [Mastigocoleus sp. MO_188.B34]|uniref:hypothetical protein n=1 Tax=Mastigocoleus sp. MO_188.B34 TaxID=3036635 RepID=UPI00263752E6|nr:hypothetical protein [Mastigocoleus sp. MO_188.B34]MDJ0696566.1 hypothetical protein [Mastigocoleus sp. MO_188.B34]